MARIAAFRNVLQFGLVDSVGRATFQYEATVAIAAIDITVRIDLEIDQRMAERGRAVVRAGADIGRTVAADTAGRDLGDFGRGRYMTPAP